MWFSKSKEEVLREFNVSNPSALQEEALIRLEKFGENKLKGNRKKPDFLVLGTTKGYAYIHTTGCIGNHNSHWQYVDAILS